MNTTDLRTPQDRFNAAVADMRRQGVQFHRNIRQCCRGCVTAEQVGLIDDSDTTTPYAWTYGSQGSAIRFDDSGQPYNVSGERPADRMYVYHGNGGGEKAAAAFRAQGLTVEWDGKDFHAVEIRFTEEA